MQHHQRACTQEVLGKGLGVVPQPRPVSMWQTRPGAGERAVRSTHRVGTLVDFILLGRQSAGQGVGMSPGGQWGLQDVCGCGGRLQSPGTLRSWVHMSMRPAPPAAGMALTPHSAQSRCLPSCPLSALSHLLTLLLVPGRPPKGAGAVVCTHPWLLSTASRALGASPARVRGHHQLGPAGRLS